MVSMPVIGRELCLLRFEMVNKWIEFKNKRGRHKCSALHPIKKKIIKEPNDQTKAAVLFITDP